MKHLTNKSKALLRNDLVDLFTPEEIQVLCFDLGIKFTDLDGTILPLKVANLLIHCENRGIIDDLLKLCKKLRPKKQLVTKNTF